MPVEGMNPRVGSSAQIRASMAQPLNRDPFLIKGQGLAAGDAQLPFHQIKPGDQFRDRMLDLQAGVHLQEIKILMAVQHKLDRARVDVLGRPRQIAGRLAHALPQFRGNGR